MIKQIAAKKVDSILSKHLTGYAFKTIIVNIPPPPALPVSLQKLSNKLNLLPPLTNKPTLPVEELPAPGMDLLPEVEEGFLLMGDVVTMIAIESEGVSQKPSLIFGDGIAHNFLDCVPTVALLNSEKIQFRLCLFRIEPVRQYGYSSMLRVYRKSKKPEDANKSELERAEMEEHLDNENEASSSFGSILTFGDRIQLRHIHSGCFLTTSREVSKERGCLRVILDSVGGEGSWLELKACSLIKKPGEAIKYSDSFGLEVTQDSAKYLIHMGSPKSWKDENFLELNASSSYTNWQVRKYISHSAILENPEFVATGDSFRILFKQNEGFLSISPRKIEEILPELEENIRGGKSVKEKKDSSCTVYIEKKKTCMSVWELVRENPFIGGIAEKEKVYKIKNVATGLLLGFSKTGAVYLTSDQNANTTLFRIIQEPSACLYHTFNTIIKIENVVTRKVLMSGNLDPSRSLFTNRDDYTTLLVESTINKKQDTRTAFTLYDEPEELTIYIYQISSLFPKIIGFYKFVKNWGCIKRGSTYTPNYELAKSTESELEIQIDFMIKILYKLEKRLLKEDSQLEEHQESFRLTGLLEILLKFVILLDKKLELPAKFPIDVLPRSMKKSKIRIIQEAGRFVKPEMMFFPGVIGLKHFSKLSMEIYLVIYKSIKDNTESCIELQKYQEFLCSQLYNYKDQVGVLLKELYKLSSGSIAKSNPLLFKVWVDQIKALNENEDNIDEQIITLKILAFLCKNENGGIPTNQNSIADHFYGFDRDYTIMRAFIMDESRPFFGFNNDKFSGLSEFIQNNPTLESLSIEDKSKMLLVYPETLGHSRKHLNYICSFFEFLTNLCLSRNDKLIQRTIETIGLTYDHVYFAITNENIHCKLRTYYLKLLWVLYFDKEGQNIISESQQRCFLWDSSKNSLEPDDELNEEKESIFSKLEKKPILLDRVITWVHETWVQENLPWNDDSTQTLADKTRFVIELIRFSKNLVDFNYVGFTFVSVVSPNLIYILGGQEENSGYWSAQFKTALTELRNIKLHSELIENIIDFFQIKFHSQVDSDVIEKLGEYCNPVIPQEEEQKSSFIKVFKLLSPKADKPPKDSEKSPRDGKTKESNSKGTPRNTSELQKITQASLDTVLLNLIFNKADDSLKEKIINLLLSNLDINKTVVKGLIDIILIPHCELRDDYKIVYIMHTQNKKLLKEITYMNPEALLEELTKENPEITTARNTIEINLKNLKSFISPKRDVSMRKYLQKIYSNIGVHSFLLKFFLEEWHWVNYNNDKVRIEPQAVQLYILIIKTLKNFAYNSLENQESLFEYLPYIEKFKSNSIGTKSLIAEVIKCRRNLKTSVKIIENLFNSMNRKNNPMESPENLFILKSLIHDESLKFYAINQTCIIKSLLVTKSLYNVFSCETSWDLSKLSSKSIKFFSMMLDIIARSAIFNEYATHQARRLIPFKILQREMYNASMLLIKKSYLHFLFYVYFMETPNIKQGISDQDIEEIVIKVIFNDIFKYKNFIDHLTGISLKGMYDPITPKKQFKAQTELRKQKVSKINLLTREQAESMEYWKYVNSHKPDTPRISSGLICIIKDITMELRSRGAISEGISYALYKIKGELQEMLNILFEKMLGCEEIDMQFMIREVALTAFEIPYFFVNIEDAEDKTEEEEAYQKLIKELKEYVENRYLPFESFIEQYLNVNEGIIDKLDFLFLVKEKLNLQIKVREVELVYKKFDPLQKGNEITITDLISDLKALFIGNPYVVRKERVESELVLIIRHEESNDLFKAFIESAELQVESEKNDIYLMVSNVKAQIIDPALENNDYTVLLKFINNLSNAFDKKEHKVYLIKILNCILLQELEKLEGIPDSQNSANSIQNLFANENVISICFNEFTKDTILENTLSALDLLTLMVKNNNAFSKDKILNFLKAQDSKIFSFIRVHLREVQDYLSSPASRIPEKRRKSLYTTNITAKSGKKNMKQLELALRILKFLQSCCNNCFTPFQEFLQVQNPENQIVNIDLVSEICQFLVCMKGIDDLKSLDFGENDMSRLAIQCIKCLTDCCQGPCGINQVLLGQRRRLYEFMNWLFEGNFGTKIPDFCRDSIWVRVYQEGIVFLNALIEANTNMKIAKIFISELNLEQLCNHSGIIWNQIIQGRERLIYQDNQGDTYYLLKCLEQNGVLLEEYEKKVIEIGFGINILLLTLQYLHPSQYRVKYANLVEKQQDALEVANPIRPGIRELIREKWRSYFSPKVFDMNKLNFSLAQDFYYSNIATVEVSIRDNLTKLFFRVPTICRYFTQKSRKDLITKVNRASHQEKIEDFMNKSKIYEVEMRHQQTLARYPLLDAFISKWRLYGKISYVTVVIINIILLVTVEHKNKAGDSWKFQAEIDSQALLTTIAIIQIILASLVYLCYLVEYMPVIKFKSKLNSKGSQYRKYLNPYFNRIKGTELMKEVLLRTSTKESIIFSHFFLTAKILIFDIECVYNLVYLIISILSWSWPLLYSVLLLDLIKRNDDLKNILRSITLNSYQLILTTLLAIIIVYCFTIVSFLSFPEIFSTDYANVANVTYCNNLFECFISNLITGIRMGGGIGDAIVQLKDNDTHYWAVMFFNILYFALVINILLNIIFGIIIDTFGELRDQNQAVQKDIKENCFICGNQRFLFEIKRISWLVHTNIEHNPYAYLAFMVYLRNKEIDDCSGAEKYVKEKLDINDTSFFPLTSLSLMIGEDEKKDEITKITEKISKIKETVLNLARVDES